MQLSLIEAVYVGLG